jgi:NitT/TauT family transport system ATP-binding protein
LVLGDRVVVMTASPGRLKDSLVVSFPRPRATVDIRGTPEFGQQFDRIWRLLEAEVRRAPEVKP